MTTEKPQGATKIVHEEQPSWQKLDEAEEFRRSNAARRRSQGHTPSQPAPSLVSEAPPEFIGSQRLCHGPVDPDPRITVSVSVRKTPKKLLERAVNSILSQTYKNLIVVVTSDGEGTPSWDGCSFLDDPRVRCNTSKHRMGPYFAHEAARQAFQSPLFAVQDADNWSDPSRLERLVVALQAHDADVALPSVVEYPRDGPATTHAPGETLNHFWLIRSDAVDALGGYYAGFMVSTDTFLARLVQDFGRGVSVPEALYHYQEQRGDTGHDEATAAQSKHRREAEERLGKLYEATQTDGLEAIAEHFQRQVQRPAFTEYVAILRSM